MSTTSELLDAAEQLARAIAELDGITMYTDPVEPADADAIAEVEARLGYPVPDPIRELWTRGFRAFFASVDGDVFLRIGWDFLDPALTIRELGGARELYENQWADEDPDDLDPGVEPFVELLRDGFPLSFENPVLFSDRRGDLFLVNYKDCRADAVGDLPTFLRHWAGSGFLRQADTTAVADAHFERIAALRPEVLAVPPGENRWVALYRSLYA